jgi:hypothetical protein
MTLLEGGSVLMRVCYGVFAYRDQQALAVPDLSGQCVVERSNGLGTALSDAEMMEVVQDLLSACEWSKAGCVRAYALGGPDVGREYCFWQVIVPGVSSS